MRTFLLTIFWITSLGSVIQLLIMASASWIIFSGAYSFFDLTVSVFITQYMPVFIWIKTFIVALLGSVGHWILTIPILIIAPIKLVVGTIIGLWAYSVEKKCLWSELLTNMAAAAPCRMVRPGKLDQLIKVLWHSKCSKGKGRISRDQKNQTGEREWHRDWSLLSSSLIRLIVAAILRTG